MDRYTKLFEKKEDNDRLNQYEQVVNSYYDLATDFYELRVWFIVGGVCGLASFSSWIRYGWGTSFHFAQRTASESLYQSLARHEHFLALKLGLRGDDHAIDIGCGVGGPGKLESIYATPSSLTLVPSKKAREIARFSGARVTGLNNNEYQITRATKLTAQEGVKGVVFQKGDFMNIPFKDNTFDHAYAIEATCHAPDRVGCYAEILRVTKPGGYFAGYE